MIKQSKKYILALGILLAGLSTPKQAQAVNLGPFSIARDFCEQVQQLAPILNSYSMVQWPVVGFPGITMGLAQNTSALLDFCNYIMQVEQLGTQDAIFFTGNYLNTLTDNRWGHHLEMADKTWNLANTVYDFEAGGMRKGAMTSASTHREINDYMKTSYSWYNKSFNGRDAQLKTRGEREQEMNQFAGAAYRRAILNEALNCPSGDGNKNYEKIYATEIKPQEIKRDEANDDITFIRGKLMEMGPRFMNNQTDLQKFIGGVERMMTQGVAYKVGTKKKTEQTTKPGAIDAKTKKPSQAKVNISKDTQVWTTQTFTEVFNDFKTAWGDNWASWVKSQYLQDSRGLLTNARERQEAQFIDLNYECNATRLMRGVDTDRADYEKLQEERYQKCLTDTAMNQKKAENLLVYYTDQLAQNLKKMKDANAKIWTAESWYLGTMRAVNTKDSTEGYQQEQVACGQNLEPAEMSKLQLKQQSVNNEYSEMTAKQVMKQTSMMEMEAKANADQLEEIKKRQAFSEQQGKRSQEALKNNISPVPVQGGI